MEAGIIGLVLMVAFAAWLVFRAVAVWRRAPPGARQLDHALARASTLIIALLLAHSFVDYPLRTEAMLAVMAVACGLLIAPPESLTEPTAAAEAAAYDNSRSEPQRTRVIIPVGGTEPPAFPAMPPERPSPPAGPPVAWPTETAPPPQPHQAVPPDQSVPPAFPAMQPAPPRVPPGQPAGPVEWAPAVTAPNRQPKAPPNAGADEWPAEWSKSTTAETPSTAPAQTPRPNPAAWRKPVDS